MIHTKSGTPIATDYRRVVYGKRGAYVEFWPEQMVKENLRRVKYERPNYFHEWRSNDCDAIMVYQQLRTVAYADYRIGMYYVAPGDLQENNQILGLLF